MWGQGGTHSQRGSDGQASDLDSSHLEISGRGFRCPRLWHQGTEGVMKLPWAEPADMEIGHTDGECSLVWRVLRTGTLLSRADEDRMNELVSFNGCTVLWAQ